MKWTSTPHEIYPFGVYTDYRYDMGNYSAKKKKLHSSPFHEVGKINFIQIV